MLLSSNYGYTATDTTELAQVDVPIEIDTWYKLEVHVRAGGEVDGHLLAADGDGYCDTQECMPATPAFYDQTGSDEE